jgi:hypothetical protein
MWLPEWPNPSHPAGWPKALPVVADVRENYGGAAEITASTGVGDTASSASGGSEVDV